MSLNCNIISKMEEQNQFPNYHNKVSTFQKITHGKKQKYNSYAEKTAGNRNHERA